VRCIEYEERVLELHCRCCSVTRAVVSEWDISGSVWEGCLSEVRGVLRRPNHLIYTSIESHNGDVTTQDTCIYFI
jgi:hypothetical protein